MSKTYEVKVLLYVNPHHIWVLPRCASAADKQRAVEHIGLYGAVAQNYELNGTCTHLEWQVSPHWQPAVRGALTDFLAGAQSVMFTPKKVLTYGSIFDDNIYKFGEITAVDSGGRIVHLSQVLKKEEFAKLCQVSFDKFLECGWIPRPLNTAIIEDIIESLVKAPVNLPLNRWKKIIQDQTKVWTEQKKFEDRTRAELSLGEAETIISKKKIAFELCKGIDLPYLGRTARQKTEDTASAKKFKHLRAITGKIKKNRELFLEQNTTQNIQSERKTDCQQAMHTNSRDTTRKIVYRETKKNLDYVPNASVLLEYENSLHKSSSQPKAIHDRPLKAESKECNRSQRNPKNLDPWSLTDIEKEHFYADEKFTKSNEVKDSFLDRLCKNGNISKFHCSGVHAKLSQKSPDYKNIISRNISQGMENVFDCSQSPQNIQNSATSLSLSRESNSNQLMAEKNEQLVSNTSAETSEHDASESSDDNFLVNGLRRLELELEILKAKAKLNKNTNHTKNTADSSKSTKQSVNVETKEHELARTQYPSQSTDKEVRLSTKRLEIVRRRQLKQDFIPPKEDMTDLVASTAGSISKKLEIVKQRQPKLQDFIQAEEVITDLDTPIPASVLERIQRNDVKKSFRPDLSEQEFKIKALEHASNFIEGVVSPKLMIHSKNKFSIKAVTDLHDIPFSPSIHQTLTEMGMSIPMTLQTFSWPAILRGHSYFMVNPRRSGKTMGYVPAVCRHVTDMKETNNSGPFVIILCDTTTSVVEVAKMCNRFLKGKRAVLTFYAGIDYNEFSNNLMNDCDILIATPFFLCKLFNQGALSLDLKFLSIVVLDGCNRIEELYYNEFKFFYKMINNMMKTRVNPYHQIQYIIAATQWCDLMMLLSQKLSNVVISIGFYQECAVYSKPSNVSMVVNESKMEKVKVFITQIDPSKRGVVVCNTDEEIQQVRKLLEAEKFQVISGGTSISIQELYAINKSWNDLNVPGMAPVFVCCDKNLRFLNITNAHYLVHYALPSTFTSFCKRFAVCIENYKSIFEEGSNEVKIEILVDSENTEQLPKVLNFMKRCKTKIPDELERMSEKVAIKKDLIKGQQHYPVCDNLLAFGECHDVWYCDKRHTLFPSCDAPAEWLPKNGVITFNILNYHSPIHYSAMITSYTVDGKRKEIAPKLNKIHIDINLYYCVKENIRLHGIPKLGDLCAVSRSNNFYERCQVVKILKTDDKEKPTLVLTKLIDEGLEHIATDVDLYSLPDNFKHINSHVLQVRLASIRPKDKDITFSDLAKESLQQKLKENSHVYMRANIALVLGDTIVVEDLDVCQDMKITNDVLKWLSVKEFLCERHAEQNEEHLGRLYKLCQAVGIPLPEKEIKKVVLKKKERGVKPQWAHLESDATPIVFFSSAENPGQFYVRLERFEDCLNNLTKDIQNYVANCKDEQGEFEEGDFVLAKFPDNLQYFRARVESLPSKASNGKIRCFFVDHGDWRCVAKEDIKVLPDSMITVLPFQAIECRLIGVQPVGDEWSDWSTNYLYQLCFLNDQDLKVLNVKYFLKECAKETGGNKYGVIMIDTHTDKNVIINDLMLNSNMAEINDNEQHFIENFTYKIEKDEVEESDVDSVVDKQCKKEDKPYKNIMYERKIEVKTLVEAKPQVKEKSKEENNSKIDDKDFDIENEFIFRELGPRSLLQLPSPSSSNTKPDVVSSGPVSSNSSFRVNSKAKEPALDDLSYPEQILRTKSQPVNQPDSAIRLKEKQPEQNSGKRVPKITWHQTKSKLTIKVEIAELKNYKLKVEARMLYFETYIHETEYAFVLNFYGAVNPKTYTHTPKGLYLLVKLDKLIKKEWLSLMADCVKRRWVVYDHDALGAEQSDEEDSLVHWRKEFNQFIEEKLEEAEKEYDDEWEEL